MLEGEAQAHSSSTRNAVEPGTPAQYDPTYRSRGHCDAGIAGVLQQPEVHRGARRLYRGANPPAVRRRPGGITAVAVYRDGLNHPVGSLDRLRVILAMIKFEHTIFALP